ncbi:MAG: SulP family inorganic anion transporter [Proteobacteria bacterium]|nr:SulP family inorganic anion transporter [Pseudomonadota bacterium]
MIGEALSTRLSRLLPGIFPLERTRILPEIFAGISLAAMNIPQAMGYARLAGVPVIAGLYTLLFPVITFALLGGARYLFVAADSATAVILSTGIGPMAQRGTELFLAHASVVALMTGGLLLIARILKLGFLADFLSRTVLIGFLSGVGVQVAIAVLGQVLGISVNGSTSLSQLWTVVTHLGSLHLPTLLVSLGVMAIILSSRRWFPRFPGALLAVLGTIGLSALLKFGDHGILLIGPVAGGVPPFTLPSIPWDHVRQLVPIAAACFVMIITQSSATSRAFGIKHHREPDENRDLLGLGVANAVAGLGGTFVVNGSPTQTAMLESCGGRSQLANLATALTVGAVLCLLTGPLKFLPLCVLGAIVFLVALRMVDLSGFRDLWSCGRKEFYVALFTASCVVFLGVEYGIVLALIVSLLDHVRRGYQPRTAVVVRDPEIHWRMEKTEPGVFVEPGVILYWFGTDLYYANAPHFGAEIRRLVEGSPGVRVVIIDCGPITSMDFTAGKALAELRSDLATRGVTIALTRVTSGLRNDLDHQRLTCEIGEKNLFRSRKQSVAAFRTA